MSLSLAKPHILFVTGTSGSGKTMLFESFKTDTDFINTDFHDIDEDGIPLVGHGPWREYRVTQLLFDSIKSLRKGKSTVICGITLPHEVFESEHFKTNAPVGFILLEASDKQIETRLKKRIAEQSSANQQNKSFTKEFASRIVNDNLRLKRKLRNSVMALQNSLVINASRASKQSLRKQVKQIILNGGSNA